MDHLGYRMKFGVLGPSTNTIVQPDLDGMRPVGVTNHYSRIVIPEQRMASNEDFLRLVAAIQDNTLQAIDVLRSCEMQYLVMGMSATTFWNGRAGAEAYRQVLENRAGVKASCGSFATEAALNAYGARRIAFLSPYFEVANAQVRRFFQDCGFTVQRDIALERPSPVQIAHTTDAVCRDALRRLDGDDVDAIVQVGTNLSMVKLAAAAEFFLGKPVIAINTATWWHALRAAGIDDRIEGFGRLYRTGLA
jgi:maleate isomerase